MQLEQAVKGHQIFAKAEGKPKRTIEGVSIIDAYFESFLRQQQMPA